MSEQSLSEIIDAILDEALKLAKRNDLTDEVEEGLNRIVSLARSKFDLRSNLEEQVAGDER